MFDNWHTALVYEAVCTFHGEKKHYIGTSLTCKFEERKAEHLDRCSDDCPTILKARNGPISYPFTFELGERFGGLDRPASAESDMRKEARARELMRTIFLMDTHNTGDQSMLPVNGALWNFHMQPVAREHENMVRAEMASAKKHFRNIWESDPLFAFSPITSPPGGVIPVTKPAEKSC